jgi:hypothetical protein
MRTTTASSPSWQSLRVPRVQGLKTGLKRDAQGMQVQKLQVVQVPVAPQEHQVEEVLDVSTIASGAPSVSGAAAHGVFGIGEQNGDAQESQVLPKFQGENEGWRIRLPPVDSPAARVGSGVSARPEELRAVRKCILAAARAARPQEKFSWKSLIKFDARLFNPYWQAGLVDSFRTDGPQLLTEQLTTEFELDGLYVDNLQKPEIPKLQQKFPDVGNKQQLGELLLPLIETLAPTKAGKITGMILELDNAHILHFLEDDSALREVVEDATQALQQWEMQHVHQVQQAA